MPHALPEDRPDGYSGSYGGGPDYGSVGTGGGGGAGHDDDGHGEYFVPSLDEDDEFNADAQPENEWFPKYRDCSCCKGYIYGCKDSTCAQLGVCGCAASEDASAA
jgi:hypothetical protein